MSEPPANSSDTPAADSVEWRQTRRSVLGGVASAIVLGIGGTAVSAQTVQPQESLLLGPDTLSQLTARAGTRAQDCAPTTLNENWQTPPLKKGTTTIHTRPGGSDDQPVYTSGFDISQPFEGGKIYAIDRADGTVLDGWPISTDGVPLVKLGDGDRLYYAEKRSRTVSVAAVDPETGSQQWKQPVARALVGLGLHHDSDNEQLYVITDGPTVTAINESDGSQAWQTKTGRRTQITVSRRDGSTVYATGNKLDPISQSLSGQLTAIDVSSDGTDRKRWNVSGENEAISAPGIGDDYVTISFGNLREQKNSRLRVIEAEDGTERWSVKREDGLLFSPVAIAGSEAVYAPASSRPKNERSKGKLEKYDAASGEKAWSFDANGMILGIQRSDTSVYIQTRPGDLFAINDDPESDGYGTSRWKRSLADSPENGIRSAGLTLSCNTLYTGTNATPGTVYAIDAETGSVQSTYTLGSGVVRWTRVTGRAVWATSGRNPDGDSGGGDLKPRLYKLTGESSPPPAGEAVMLIEPAPIKAKPESDGEFTLRIEEAGNGVGSYEATVETGDSDILALTDATITGDPASKDVTVTDTRATLTVDMGENPHTSRAVDLATIRFETGTAGSTTISLDDVAATDPNGSAYTITEASGADVTVSEDASEGPPPVVGDSPPTDPDGDGLYEDLNGDGKLTVADVQLYFTQIYRKRDSEYVQNNRQYFDYNRDGSITVADLQMLFREYLERSQSTHDEIDPADASVGEIVSYLREEG